NQSRSITPQAEQYLGEPSDSDSDFPAPPDYLLPITVIGQQTKISTNNLHDRSEQLLNYSNMKSNSLNNSLPTIKREPFSTLTTKRNTSSTTTTDNAVKFPTLRQTNFSCNNNCNKAVIETNGDNIQNEADNNSKSKQ
ncbi:unnamed protein product, partial [Onchocerca flexuosa]|uniref:Uncharacterized protein n=1 Tax=Onchocerca flexuosa TaxID=387005 RepID=A0A183HH16_9BILA